MKETLRKAVEKVVTVIDDEPEQKKRLLEAAETALTGFAHDGGSWQEGRAAFETSINNGDSVNTALYNATSPIAYDLEVSTGASGSSNVPRAEALVRFWDAMGPHEEGEAPTPAIERALTGFAPDGGSWLAARDEFNEAIARGVRVDIALDAALNTIKQDSETPVDVARDRFYAGIDPDYAENEHYAGRKHGIRVGVGEGSLEVGIGPDVQKRRERKLGRAARHHQRS